MRHRLVLVAAVMLLAGALAGANARAAKRATVQLRHTKRGTILVNGQGYTLYTFSRDSRNHDACAAIPGCLGVWPALTSRKPTAGRGVKRRLLGTIKVPGVGRQVTYAGHPLYGYVGDDGPADTSNINIYQSGGYWPAITAAGRAVR